MQKLDLAVLPCFYEALRITFIGVQVPARVVVKDRIKRSNGSVLYLVRVYYNNILDMDKLLELAQKRALEGYDKFELEAN